MGVVITGHYPSPHGCLQATEVRTLAETSQMGARPTISTKRLLPPPAATLRCPAGWVAFVTRALDDAVTRMYLFSSARVRGRRDSTRISSEASGG
jgi:hypothetical protein